MKFKKLFTCALFLLPFCLYAQDTTYYNINNKKVKSMNQASYYKIATRDSADSNRNIEREYSLSGKIKSERHFKVKVNKKDTSKVYSKLDGKFYEWYENGQLWKDIEYKDGELEGKLLTYWNNGKPKRQENFEKGKSIEGKCFNSTGKEIEFIPYEIMPQFRGGKEYLLEFISRNLKYPKEMQKMGIQGRSIVGFVVQKDGSIRDIKIVRSASSGLDEAAIMVIKSLPAWKPGLLDGEPVSVYYTVPIVFRLNP